MLSNIKSSKNLCESTKKMAHRHIFYKKECRNDEKILNLQNNRNIE